MVVNELININIEDKSVLLLVNPKIYPLDVIYSACYVFLDKVYVLLDGDPEKEVLVKLKLKENTKDFEDEMKKMSGEFFNELLNYSFCKKQGEKNKKIRETLLETALIGVLRENNEKEKTDSKIKETDAKNED